MEKEIKNALQYVRDNKSWSDEEEFVALNKINNYRCNIQLASKNIADEIENLMDEYGMENGLPEDYWSNYSVDDIFFEL